MTKRVQLRVVVWVDDDVTLAEVKPVLARYLAAQQATEQLDPLPEKGGPDQPLLDGTGRRIFWNTTEVRQGAETRAASTTPRARPVRAVTS